MVRNKINFAINNLRHFLGINYLELSINYKRYKCYSPMWNPHYNQKINAILFKKLIESYKLIVNNSTDFPIYLSNQKILIINLALTSSD